MEELPSWVNDVLVDFFSLIFIMILCVSPSPGELLAQSHGVVGYDELTLI